MQKILEVKNVGKKFQSKDGEVQAIKDVNFEVEAGEFVSIIGPSGCGKSTLLSIIAGLGTKSEGEIYIENEKITNINGYNVVIAKDDKVKECFKKNASDQADGVMKCMKDNSIPNKMLVEQVDLANVQSSELCDYFGNGGKTDSTNPLCRDI